VPAEVHCTACGTANDAGRKFCRECGSSLAHACPSCGTPNEAGVKFCGECGTALAADGPKDESTHAAVAPAAERRLVSVLFADLVGFTTVSEGRDAEETRELLTSYFDTARTIVERYGGTIEKFIGDAVMAVWGTPTATEDDAERAVRAALELVSTIPDLHAGLQARAGVLTGEAAVTLGAEGQGMVAGDLVNTASRIQSAATPGTVLVGEGTRSAADAAIAFEDGGVHELKGKAEPMQLWSAVRVVANRGGEGRSAGLEAPFVGRDRELRIVKDLFQASADESRAHLVLVTGGAGIGKSRLAWEFEKYIDGLTADVWWHRGRCLSYGEGVAYWALAEMVRGRARILESEDAATASAKLTAAIAEHVADPDDRDWIEPRLAHLLGLADASFEREDLFAGWRLFIERLADEAPTVLVFEDLQWADAGLLDFVEYLVEWARAKPIFVFGLARPELADRRPGFGTATRGGFTGLALEPLSGDAMHALLEGLVPGLPDGLRDSITARAGGIPLYAVETVRMLLNRGQLEAAEGAYRVVGRIEELEVPETLHALVASRIDGLDPDERRLVQDASVLGKTFVLDALVSVSGRPPDELEPMLRSLVRKELFFLEADPRSAERGQYGFLQDLVRHVAYETLARRDRKARHLGAAAFFEGGWGGREQEVVEVIASHYVTALDLDPDADDADVLRTKARETLERAGERAASLGASAEAARLYARAAVLSEDAVEEARLRAAAGNASRRQGDFEAASAELIRAIELYESAGDLHAAARVSADLAEGESITGRLGDAIERMERAYTVLAAEDPDEHIAYFLSQLARWLFFAGDIERSSERNERALEVAERMRLPEVLSHALNTKGLLEAERGNRETARGLIGHALRIALENDAPGAALRAYINASITEDRLGNLAEAEDLNVRCLELARRIGDRDIEWTVLGNLASMYAADGRWDEVDAIVDQIPEGMDSMTALYANAAEVARHRGDLGAAKAALAAVAGGVDSASMQDRSMYVDASFSVFYLEGRYDEAADVYEGSKDEISPYFDPGAIDNSIAEASVAGGRFGRAAEAVAAVEALPPGQLTPYVRALATRYRSVVAAQEGDDMRAEESFKQAAAMCREYRMTFYLAATQLEQAEWLAARDRGDEAADLVEEARETFERLRAAPWLERANALVGKLQDAGVAAQPV
jgi:class 3 adenylate cyclase/tetratricopeptide (TPR) repeat protein